MNIFINEKEKRLRAGWRLFLQLLIMILILGACAIGLSFILPWNSLLTTSTLPFFLGTILSVWIAAQYFDKRPFTDYGININKLWLKEYLIGIVIAAAAQGAL